MNLIVLKRTKHMFYENTNMMYVVCNLNWGYKQLFQRKYKRCSGNFKGLRTEHENDEENNYLIHFTQLSVRLLGLLQLEHRPSTIPLQRTRFWAASHAPFQLSFWALSSASVSRLQLLQGRPLLRFPWGFQLRACLVMLAGGFLSVWPIQPHFLWRICLASGSCPARSHKSVLLILSGHRMPRIRRRQVLTKHWIFWCNALVVRHVSHPYSNTDLTLELKILSLVQVLISVDPQIFFNRTKAPLALPTLALTSWSVPPFLSTTLPRYTKLSTSFICSPTTVIGVVTEVLL